MSSYNQVNGSFASANWYLQKQILKKETGFDGVLMSDWGGVHSPLAINGGCDLEMPGGRQMTPRMLGEAMKNGDVSQENVDDAARRIIRTIIRVGLMDGPPAKPDPAQINSPEHQKLALQAAEEGIVLLKNQNQLLPLSAGKIHSIAMVGPACKSWQMGTGGSAAVRPVQFVSAFDGIVTRAGKGVSVTYTAGCESHYTGNLVPASVLAPAVGTGPGMTGEYFAGYDFTAKPAATRLDAVLDFNFSNNGALPAPLKRGRFCARWKGTLTAPMTGTYRMDIEAQSGARLFIDEQPILDTWPGSDGGATRGKVDLVAGQNYRARIEYIAMGDHEGLRWTWLTPGENLFADAAQAARQADAAVVMVGSGGEAEDSDRQSMDLPGVQNELIRAVSAANPRTIVVLNNGGPVLVSDWIDHVPALIEAWFPGQAGGTALAQILFGDVNPSGKLVYTMGKSRKDYSDFGRYPIRRGTFDPGKGLKDGIVDYSEGIYVGYRFFDKNKTEPSFPFGFGLSYTTFLMSKPAVSMATMSSTGEIRVTVDVTNTGQRVGAEVVQLYIRANEPKIDRPLRELKGFSRIDVQPGETKEAVFLLGAKDLVYCDVAGKRWKADAGSYTLEFCDSSRDPRASAEVRLTQDYTLALPGIGAPSPYASPTGR